MTSDRQLVFDFETTRFRALPCIESDYSGTLSMAQSKGKSPLHLFWKKKKVMLKRR